MGINSRVFDLLAMHCRREESNGRALIAGYPDMLVDIGILEKHLVQPLRLLVDGKQAEIQKVHGWDRPVPCPHDVFRALGYRLTIIDIHADHGEEVIVDLNKSVLGDEDVPQGNIEVYFDKGYDLVVDHGTIEHCFNIGQAALNLIGAIKQGGWIVMHLPFNVANHGFYNINPTWYFDLAQANGLKIEHFEAWNPHGELWELPRHARFSGTPDDTLCTMVAQRVADVAPTMPIQRRYQQ